MLGWRSEFGWDDDEEHMHSDGLVMILYIVSSLIFHFFVSIDIGYCYVECEAIYIAYHLIAYDL